jgi:hypothetical protein
MRAELTGKPARPPLPADGSKQVKTLQVPDSLTLNVSPNRHVDPRRRPCICPVYARQPSGPTRLAGRGLHLLSYAIVQYRMSGFLHAMAVAANGGALCAQSWRL